MLNSRKSNLTSPTRHSNSFSGVVSDFGVEIRQLKQSGYQICVTNIPQLRYNSCFNHINEYKYLHSLQDEISNRVINN